MKLDLIFGSVVLLIAGITLAGNPLEVSGQSQEELKSMKIQNMA